MQEVPVFRNQSRLAARCNEEQAGICRAKLDHDPAVTIGAEFVKGARMLFHWEFTQ